MEYNWIHIHTVHEGKFQMGQKFKSKIWNHKNSRWKHMRVILLPRNGKITSIIMQNEKARRKKTHFMYLKNLFAKMV